MIDFHIFKNFRKNVTRYFSTNFLINGRKLKKKEYKKLMNKKEVSVLTTYLLGDLGR